MDNNTIAMTELKIVTYTEKNIRQNIPIRYLISEILICIDAYFSDAVFSISRESSYIRYDRLLFIKKKKKCQDGKADN